MPVDSLKLEFTDGSTAEIDFQDTDDEPRIHLWPAPGVSLDDLRERAQDILDAYFTD